MRHKFVTYDKEKNCLRFFYDDDEWFEKFVVNLGYDKYDYDQSDLLIFLRIPNITKADILELFEFLIFGMFWAPRIEGDEIMIWTHLRLENLDENASPNPPKPTYISEYINVIGQLFLAGYIDFGSYYDNDDREKIDYPTNLSYYKEDKYQAWIYFRDNFFYTDAYYRDIIDFREKYPNMSDDDYRHADWNTPQYWDRYMFWVARTPKGDEYFEKVLAPRFYNKYKDLEVEIDSKGNIVRWIGEINR